MFKKIDNLKAWQVGLILPLVGFSVFFSGLTGGWQGDDTDQIIKNTAVHSILNVGLFFRSSTFWNGEALVGDFYRPMMSTTYALIYSFFGAQPIAFHVVQLLIYVASAFILFLLLKLFFRPALALLVALIFLVHPINSQVVYSIPSMQEPLMLLFGLSALYILVKSQTNKSLVGTTALLFLALLSKETAVVFVCLAALYLFLYHKSRLLSFIKIVSLPVILYILIRTSVVGLRNITQSAPIDLLNFGQRILMIPSMLMFYLRKFIFPENLATSYYWTYKSPSFEGFILPLLILLICVAGLVFAGKLIYQKAGKKSLITYLFFSAWTILGIAPYMQIVALDMTACETWFIVAIIGLLGMLAVILKTMLPRIQPAVLLAISLVVLIALGVRSELRGLDYHNQATLALKDIAVTDRNYLAMNNLSKYYIDNNQIAKAEVYAKQSIDYFPSVTNYNNLGVIQQKMNDYAGARQSYLDALQITPLGVTYENIAITNFVVGKPADNIAFLKKGLSLYPKNNRLWTYLAIEEAASGSSSEAKTAILNAYHFGPIPSALYLAIINHTPLDVPILDSGTIVHIP